MAKRDVMLESFLLLQVLVDESLSWGELRNGVKGQALHPTLDEA
jgi:hypothetical protein